MAPLGVDEAAEELYRALLGNPGASTGDLVTLLRRPSDLLELQLADLRRLGLASALGGEASSQWYATAPDVAVELLLMARQAELNEARLVLPDLQRDLLQGTKASGGKGGVHVVPADRQSQLQAYLQIHQCARREVLIVQRPPFGVSAPDEIENARNQARQRGVHYRLLLDPQLLQLPGWPEALKFSSSCGDEIRVLAALPFKMVLADHQAGLVPAEVDATGGSALLLSPGSVLEAMYIIFEQLWRDAAPANLSCGDGPLETDLGEGDMSVLLSLLASGCNDKTIADTLGISDRTLQRRVQVLHARLGARTRFQCGWMAARKLAKEH